MDITEDANLIQTENRKTNIRSIDFKLYRQQVQGALEPLFQQKSGAEEKSATASL